MSLLKSLFTVICAGFLLSACSSTALVDQSVYDEISKISVSIDKGRSEQLYRQELERLISRNGLQPERYQLRSKITSSSGDNIMVMVVSFTLYDQETGETVLSHRFSSSASTGGVSSLFGSAQAENHAKERLSLSLAQKTFGQLTLFFSQKNLEQ